MDQDNYSQKIFGLLLVIVIFLIAAIFKFTAPVTRTITISLLLACVFYPLLKKMNSIHIPWALGIVIILFISVLLVFFIGNILTTSAIAIYNAYPKYEDRFTSIYAFFVKTFNLPYDENSTLWNNLRNQIDLQKYLQTFAISASSNILGFLKVFMTVFIFLLFLLIEMRSMHDKVELAYPLDEGKTSKKLVKIGDKVISEVTHYISIKFLISLITGFLVFASTAVIKMDFPVIWGFIAFILNFIPTFGSIISWALTTTFALLQFFPNWGLIIYVAAMVLLINFILGNFIEPKWEGSDLGLSPFVIIVSLSLWGWIWGFVGMIVAVPLTVTIKIIFENIPILEPFAILLGNGKESKTQKKKKELLLKKKLENELREKEKQKEKEELETILDRN